MRKLSLATCLSACALTAPVAIACPLTDGVYADTGCIGEALEDTIKAHGLMKIPMTTDEMRAELYTRDGLRKEYADRLRACLARTHDCEGPAPMLASPIEEISEKIVSVVYCVKGSYQDSKTFKPATAKLYCPANTECQPVGNKLIGRTYKCVARNHHICHGRSVSIACPNGWECVNSLERQTCRKKG